MYMFKPVLLFSMCFMASACTGAPSRTAWEKMSYSTSPAQETIVKNTALYAYTPN